jgi:hypothetical protein
VSVAGDGLREGRKFGLSVNASDIGWAARSSWFIGGSPRICSNDLTNTYPGDAKVLLPSEVAGLRPATHKAPHAG